MRQFATLTALALAAGLAGCGRPAPPATLTAATDWRPYCWSAANQVRGGWFGMAGAEVPASASIGALPGPAGGLPVNLSCPVKGAAGPGVVRVTVHCARSGDWACVEVTGVEDATGKPLEKL